MTEETHDTSAEAVEDFIQSTLREHVLSEGLPRDADDTKDTYKIVELLRTLARERDTIAERLAEVEAERDAANRRFANYFAETTDLANETRQRAEAAEAKLAEVRDWCDALLDAAEQKHKDGGAEMHRLIRTPPNIFLDTDQPAPRDGVTVVSDPCAALERAVLHALPGQIKHPNFGYDYFSCLSVIADDAGVDKEAARFACKRLRDKGLALYQSGLFNEYGEPCGSGYALTDEGRAALRALTEGGE